MSVTTNAQELGCFFCHNSIPPTEKCVEWQGCRDSKTMQPYIRLHAKCAVMLAQRLIGDAFAANPGVEEPDNVLYLVKSRMKFGG